MNRIKAYAYFGLYVSFVNNPDGAPLYEISERKTPCENAQTGTFLTRK